MEGFKRSNQDKITVFLHNYVKKPFETNPFMKKILLLFLLLDANIALRAQALFAGLAVVLCYLVTSMRQ